MITTWEDRARSRLNKAPLSGAHNRNQVYLPLWKILVHGIVFCIIYIYFFYHDQDMLISSIKEDIFLIKLAVRLCVRQIVTEPIILSFLPSECSHEDINRKRSHFVCKKKGGSAIRSQKLWFTLAWGRAQWATEKLWRREAILTMRTDSANNFTEEALL